MKINSQKPSNFVCSLSIDVSTLSVLDKQTSDDVAKEL